MGKKQLRRNFKNVCIVYRPSKPEAFAAACDLVEWLRIHKITAYSSADEKLIPGTRKLTNQKQIEALDLVVVLGGDGTYLRTVQLLNGLQTPVLGVNLGSLGFLTETRVDDLYKCLDLAMNGKMVVRERAMLAVSLERKGRLERESLALNDVVIERGPTSRLINLSIFSDNSLISELKADGLVITTPTGSTAYNLAAGGPIMHPETPAIAITPICPHSLTDRPITLPDNRVITIRVNEPVQKAVFMVDGVALKEIDERDVIKIQRSPKIHAMLTQPENDYFDILKTKLNFGQRN